MRRKNLRLIAVSALICLLMLLAVAGAAAEMAGGATVTGYVWLDSSGDGLRGGNESLLNRTEVTLERVVGSTTETVATVTTARDGLYSFTGLPAGDYCLAITLPNDHQFTLHGLDSAALPASGRSGITPNFSVGENAVVTMDIGATKQASRLSMSAFEDQNANGGRMDSEPRVRDVTVNLMYDFGGKAYVIATETTNRTGECTFEDLSPATYYLSVTLPENFLPGPLGAKQSIYYNCLLPSKTNRCVSTVFTLSGKTSLGLSMGMVETGMASGSLWFDQDNDGARTASDRGLTEATVLLTSPEMSLTYDVAVNADGSYAIAHVMPGNYMLSVQLPDHMMFAPDDSAITDDARQGTVPVTVSAGQNALIAAVGAMPTTELSVFVYRDMDINGENNDGDTGYEGAIVAAYRNGALLRQAATDASGEALLSAIRGGSVEIVCTLKDGDIFTISGAGNDFYSPGATKEIRIAAELPSGEATMLHAGVTQPATMSGDLYMSADNTGVYAPGSEMLAGFTVRAINENGEIAAETTTDAGGAFSFAVLPSRHMARFLFIDPYIAAPYNETGNVIEYQTQESGDTAYYDLTPGQALSGVRGALFAAGEVDGYVIMDEPGVTTGLEGVTATLLDEFGAPVSDFAYDVTDENGYFYIKGVLPGTYSILYTVPYNMAFTSPLTDQPEIESQPFVIEAMSRVKLPDVAAVRTGAVSGHVYHMLSKDNFAPLEADISVTSVDTEAVYETRALDDGEYILSGLRPGHYTLTVTLPDGYIVNEAPDSIIPLTLGSVASADFSIGLDENIIDADIVASLPASLEGKLYFDHDRSYDFGEADAPVGGTVVSLVRGEEQYDLETDALGVFTASMLPPGDYSLTFALDSDCIVLTDGATQEGLVWSLPVTLPDNATATGNEIGVLKYAEITGQIWNMDGTNDDVAGLTVSLMTADGTPIASAVTDEEGRYAFDSLYPGDYMLDTTPPAGCLFAREVDAAVRTSVILGTISGSKQSVPFPLGMGEKLNGCDIGIGAIGGIGDLAWLDTDGNGMQDLGEPPMPGIQITLFQYGEQVAQTVTDAYGRYEIDNLYPGAYVMQVVMHDEIKATKHETEFPLVSSILPEESGTTVTVESVTVTSGRINRACDLGFALRKKNVYPDAMDQTPATDWRPYSERPDLPTE